VKKYIIDTNALISFVTDRNLIQQEAVLPLFVAASSFKCMLICHQFVLTEFIFVMDKVYSIPKAAINKMVSEFIVMPGVEVRHNIDFACVLSLWPSQIADFGDAVIAATGKAVKGSIIVTFDEKLKTSLQRMGQTVYSS
jgi:predicted nucleic-acid-binding protein